MPENCDAACVKNIINTRLIAYIATLLAEACGEGHALYKRARLLAAAARAACETYAVAIEEGLLAQAKPRPEWKGCEDAVFLMQLVGMSPQDLNRAGIKNIFDKMDALIDRSNRITSHLVRIRELAQ